MTTSRVKLRVGQYITFYPPNDSRKQEGLVLHIDNDGMVKVVEDNGTLHTITFKQIKGIIP